MRSLVVMAHLCCSTVYTSLQCRRYKAVDSFINYLMNEYRLLTPCVEQLHGCFDRTLRVGGWASIARCYLPTYDNPI